MKIITDPYELQSTAFLWKQQGHCIGLVPTMGFFHAGHESLMEAARDSCDKVIVTLFVNPAQFGPSEDLSSYPKNQENDITIAERHAADILFIPDASSIYLPDASTWVEVEKVSQGLCAKSRPTHFRGVTTVVAKLFLLAQPTKAFFGKKDWQQLAVLRRMVRDLFFPIEIVGMPIVREEDGLALSSRNAYLVNEERNQAPFIQKGLKHVAKLVASGMNDTEKLTHELERFFAKNIPLGEVDYIAFVHPETLTPVSAAQEQTLLAVAVKIGKARLIDNLLLHP